MGRALHPGKTRHARCPLNPTQPCRKLTFYSCFISYSTKDQDFADRLYADLQARGVRVWFAPHDIQGGRKIHEQIDEAIR
ncbi:MAG TPA: toll/interleukin-1 receptor domain-containing protein, partial [Pirellulaceae bacterium]|nr:toll/interleukin-1 receptor domain-containing protein [Pirellulaceae bacterium]